MEKIFPLNLTAKAAAIVTGNPVTTRLEGGVGNCFPGLEFDHRNLDRRFFPGLIFEFGDSTGAQLVRVDSGDPDLDPATFEGLPADAPPPAVQSTLQTALGGATGTTLGQGSWVLDSIKQDTRTMAVGSLDAMTAWGCSVRLFVLQSLATTTGRTPTTAPATESRRRSET